MTLLPPLFTLFPYTTLFRSVQPIPFPFHCGSLDRLLSNGQRNSLEWQDRSEEHTSEPSHRCISYAVFCLKKKRTKSEEASKRAARPHKERARLMTGLVIVTI